MMYKFGSIVMAHPALIINLALIFLIAFVIWWTGQALVILAVFAVLFHSSQQIVPHMGDIDDPEPGEYDGSDKVGFTK